MQQCGSTLKSIRSDKGLYLKEVSRKTGINKTLLSRIENNKRLPTKEQIDRLCRYYKIQKKEIMVQWLSDKLLYLLRGEDLVSDAIRMAAEKINAGKKSAMTPFCVTAKKPKNICHFLNKVIQGDCLTVMKGLPDSSIDMILCDLPYGTTRNKWDSVIDLEKLWNAYERIIKDTGVIALTAQGPFTARLIISNERLFRYKIVWIKSKSTNFLNAKIQPLRKHEDICIFYKKQPDYTPQMTNGEAYDKGIRKDQYTGSYGDFKPSRVKSNGARYPNDVVHIEEQSTADFVYFKTAESEGKVIHPTQKPIELGRYLIKTYSKPGDIILDNACGSGSFLLSAILEHRAFIGIEKNEEVILHKIHPVDYISICQDRIKETLGKIEKEK